MAGEQDSNYSTIAMATLNKESIYETATDSTCANPAAKDTAQGKSKVVICSAAIFAGIILLIVLSSCFIALFINIANLQTKLDSSQQTLPNTIVARLEQTNST